MNILPGFKLCRKGLHAYPADKQRCPDCKREYNQRWKEANPDRERENILRWKEQNPERNRELIQRWRKQNPDLVREYKRRWADKNREQVREKGRRWYEKNVQRRQETCRIWRKQNQDKIRAYSNKRRATKKRATPPWADHNAINAIYAEAVRLEKETGIKHHVDHVYPLSSSYLCGLHIAENLQVLPGTENFSKGNRTWPGQLDCQKLPIKKVFTPEQIALAQEQTDPI